MNTKILTKNELSEAAAILREGGIVAMPTETVYGLAANALDTEAVQKIYLAKGRQSDNPLIVHIANISDWAKLVDQIPPKAKLLAERFWPGPLTIILKKSALVPDIVSGGLDTVAVRMPKNKVAFRLIKECGVPLAAPSANLSGAPSPTKFSHVLHDMNGRVDAIIDGGDCMVGLESTVISLVEPTPMILRPGRITAEQIRKVIGEVAIHHTATAALEEGESALSPGMKYKHYSPKAALRLLKGDDNAFIAYIKQHADETTAVICYEEQLEALADYPTFSLGAKKDNITHAKRIFDILRALDENGFTKAFAPLSESNGVGLAVNNRLLRAAGFDITDLTAAQAQEEPRETAAAKKHVESVPALAKKTAPKPQAQAATAKKAETPADDAPKTEHTNTEAVPAAATQGAPVAPQPAVQKEPVIEDFSAFEEDSVILALNEIKFNEDFNEDFSKAISDNITVVEVPSEEDPSKFFYEATIDEDGVKPAAYPVDTIDDDFQFDVYEEDLKPKKKGLFARLFGKKDEEEEEPEPEPFLPMPNHRWNAQAQMKHDTDAIANAGNTIAAKANQYEKIPGIKVVGITGKSGCGKTYITEKLAAKTADCLVINADAVYHTMLQNDSMKLRIVAAFGDSVLEGTDINRKKLAILAFASEESLQKLNHAVLPAVAEEIIDRIKKAKTQGITTVFLDAPTLIESGLYQVCNEVIFITADPAIRQERIVKRDNITLDEIGRRMRFEKEDEFYVRFADRIIRNN